MKIKLNPGHLIMLSGIIVFVFFGIVANDLGEVRVEHKKIEIENHHNICKNLNLEYLSITKQFIGDNFIICYNNQTKETKEIPI